MSIEVAYTFADAQNLKHCTYWRKHTSHEHMVGKKLRAVALPTAHETKLNYNAAQAHWDIQVRHEGPSKDCKQHRQTTEQALTGVGVIHMALMRTRLHKFWQLLC
jgi:hypothetical protein